MFDMPGKTGKGKMTVAGQVAEMIIKKIITGEIEQGLPVRESKLAKELEISRNAVREALNLIVGMGILEYEPYCGYRTKTFTLQRMLEWYEIREGIEPIACRRLAISRPLAVIRKLEEFCTLQAQAFKEGNLFQAFNLDSEFHLAIIRGSGNALFNDLADSGFISISFLFKNQLLTGNPNSKGIYFSDDDARKTIESHMTILNAIKSSDPETAENEAGDHANIQVRTMERLISQSGGQTPINLNLAEALVAANPVCV